MTNNQWVIVFVNISRNIHPVIRFLLQNSPIDFLEKRMSVRNSEVEVNGWTTFDVPNQFEDLQKQLATGSYYVQNILDLADINTRLQSKLNPSFTLNHFSSFYSDISRIREPRELLEIFPLFYSIAM